MHFSDIRRITLAAAIAGVLVLPASPALAHGDVASGGLDLTIGFAHEPAFANQPNAVQLVVEHDGEPVIDLRPGDVQVEISYGDDTSEPMNLSPAFFFEGGRLVSGEAGDYRADFVPSQPGRYTFHVTGTIEGEEVDEEMTSGPQTFATVEDASSMTFPAVEAPSIDEIVTRIDAESTRAADGVAAAEAAAASAEEAASSARTVGMVGIALGAIGIVAAIAALASSRRKA
ncbi:MAG TPA: hypothetical protein VF351_02315 [Actinomycetota bacterium]